MHERPDVDTGPPNLLIIGAAECGTTSLHAYLRDHPSVFMSKTKEFNFLDAQRNLHRGTEWYRQQFAGAVGPIRGETSPKYASRPLFDGVAEQIAQTLVAPRFILIVQDPVARMVSQWT